MHEVGIAVSRYIPQGLAACLLPWGKLHAVPASQGWIAPRLPLPPSALPCQPAFHLPFLPRRAECSNSNVDSSPDHCSVTFGTPTLSCLLSLSLASVWASTHSSTCSSTCRTARLASLCLSCVCQSTSPVHSPSPTRPQCHNPYPLPRPTAQVLHVLRVLRVYGVLNTAKRQITDDLVAGLAWPGLV